MRQGYRRTSLIYRHRACSGNGRVRSARRSAGLEMPTDPRRYRIGTLRGMFIASRGGVHSKRQPALALVAPTNPHRAERAAPGARWTT
jgi:hypothetical protein